MLGNNIILSERPMGRRIDGVAYQTAMFPGTCLQIVAGVGPDNGNRYTWRPWNRTTGFQGLIAIADVDWNQGFTVDNPGYQIGRRFPIYLPLPGDEINMLLAELIGTTGDPAIALGDELAAQTGTGQLIKTAAGTAGGTQHQFEAMETLATALGREWCHVIVV